MAALGTWRGSAGSDLVGAFETHLQLNLLLAFFIPGIVYLADAVGTQTETVVVRGLSLGVPMRRMIGRELLTGVLIGMALAVVAVPFVWWRWSDAVLALSLGLSVFAACSTATLAAMMLPWLFDTFALDPAFGSVLSQPSFKTSCPSGSICPSRLSSCHDPRFASFSAHSLSPCRGPSVHQHSSAIDPVVLLHFRYDLRISQLVRGLDFDDISDSALERLRRSLSCSLASPGPKIKRASGCPS